MATTRHFALHRLPLGLSTDGPDAAQRALFAAHDGPWLDALVPKRWARRAVRRNLVRRQIHAVGAQVLGERLAGNRDAWLLRLRAPWDRSAYPSASSPALKRAVRRELLELLARVTP